MLKHLDQEFSFTDCVSFVVMKELRLWMRSPRITISAWQGSTHCSRNKLPCHHRTLAGTSALLAYFSEAMSITKR